MKFTVKELKDLVKFQKYAESNTIEGAIAESALDGCRETEFDDTLSAKKIAELKKAGFKVKMEKETDTFSSYVPSNDHEGLYEKVEEEEDYIWYVISW
jgi:hypothetical protein